MLALEDETTAFRLVKDETAVGRWSQFLGHNKTSETVLLPEGHEAHLVVDPLSFFFHAALCCWCEDQLSRCSRCGTALPVSSTSLGC